MDYGSKYLGSTFYSDHPQPYSLSDYQPGCGLRQRKPFYPTYGDQPVYQQPVYQQPPYVIRTPIPVSQNQVSAISFKTIPPPADETRKSIRIVPSQIALPPNPSKFRDQARPSIVLEPQANLRESSRIHIPVQETAKKIEEAKEKPQPVVQFTVPEQNKNQLAIPVKIEENPNQFNMLAMQNQSFMNLRASQGKSQITFGQQKSQQISYSSQMSQSTKTQSREVIQRKEEQSMTKHQEMNNETKTISDGEIHIVSEEESSNDD